MDKAAQTMIDNLKSNSGKTLEQWIDIVKNENLTKHGEIIKFLKERHGFTHGFANLVALKSKGSDAGSAANTDSLVEKQYQGKEHFKPLYDRLISEIGTFGQDIETAPKNAYVSLRRKKQFAVLKPATKSRFEIGINLKGQEPVGILEVASSSNSMCTHQINLTGPEDMNEEVINWIRTAYENAG